MDQIKEENIQEKNQESRSNSIENCDIFRELPEPTSVELLRNSILRSIVNKETPTKAIQSREQVKYKSRCKSEITDIYQGDPDVKFLKKRCSSFNSPPKENSLELESSQSQTSVPVSTNVDIGQKLDSLNDINELGDSNSFETSGESSDKKELVNESGTETIVGNLTESEDFKDTSKNSLKLAFRTSSNNIFEDCSTYNITCSEVNTVADDNPESDETSRPDSISNSDFKSSYLENDTMENPVVSEMNDTKSILSNNRTDDQNSLCDTFFSHVINGDCAPALPNLSLEGNTDRKQSQTESDLKKTKSVSISDCDNVSIYSVESFHGRKNSKRIRKRNRKSQSKEPYVYECPKCGASYVISSKMANDSACCLHCDLWTSVEPVFMKREKLTWNTCRIC